MSHCRTFLLSILSLFAATSLAAQTLEDVMRVANVELAEGSQDLKFASVSTSLGAIGEDDGVIEGEFSYVNVGDSPLVFVKVVSSCSCLTVSYPKQPIARGESGKITFKYNPRGFPGSLQRKIFVYTNLSSSHPTALLELTGYVKKSADPTINYKFSMSDLYLKQTEVSFKNGYRAGVETIKCYNNSDRELHLKAMAGFLPQGLTFRTEPEVIAPHSECELIIGHDPNVWSSDGSAYKIIINGLVGKPSQRSIDVKFEYKNN